MVNTSPFHGEDLRVRAPSGVLYSNILKIKYTLKKLYPGIYLCTIKDAYDLTMTFCRVQEFYESPHKHIRGKKFKLLDFMREYSATSGCFTYPLDWGGFNVPGRVVDKLYDLGIDDYNEYDRIIECIHLKINSEVKPRNNYYLIGSNDDQATIQHEVCHALFTLDKAYKKSVLSLLKKLKRSTYNKALTGLKNLGYGKHVMDDELQAYLSVDYKTIQQVSDLTEKQLKDLREAAKIFRDHFKSYIKKIKLDLEIS